MIVHGVATTSLAATLKNHLAFTLHINKLINSRYRAGYHVLR